jgi:hypothetical protein
VSQWGVFHDDRDDSKHVAPVLSDGRLALNHQLTQFCRCGPVLDTEVRFDIWIHQDPEHGGYNS